MAKTTNAPNIEAELKAAIVASPDSHYRVAKRAGISVDIVGRFLNGRDIQISTAAKLATAQDCD